MAEQFEVLRFAGGISALSPGQPVEKGYQRLYRFGSIDSNTVCVLLSMEDRTTRDPIDILELTTDDPGQNRNNWAIVQQENALPWEPDTLMMQGLKVKLAGFLAEYASTQRSAKPFSYPELIRLGLVATAGTSLGFIVVQAGHGFNAGDWVTSTMDGFVPGQPDDPVLRETDGYVGLVIDDGAFVLCSHGFGLDPNVTDIDQFWDYDADTLLILDKGGQVTDQIPAAGPYRLLAKVIGYGVGLVINRTVYPGQYRPVFDTWPDDAQLRATEGLDGFRLFTYVGGEPGRMVGNYYNPNAGKADGLPVSQPTRL